MLTFGISYQPSPRWLTPFIDIYDLEDKVIILADMPGVSEDQIDVTVENDQLTIRGRSSIQTDGTHLVRECPRPDYYRVMKLSEAIDTEQIQAKMSDGVLTLILSKREPAQPVKIPIVVE